MSLRSDLADLLRANLPAETFHVMPYMKEIDNASKRVVMVHRSNLRRSAAHRSALEHDVKIHALVPETLGEAAEDAADECLEAVLRIVEATEDIEWASCERAAYNNFAGWEITLTASTPNYLKAE